MPGVPLSRFASSVALKAAGQPHNVGGMTIEGVDDSPIPGLRAESVAPLQREQVRDHVEDLIPGMIQGARVNDENTYDRNVRTPQEMEQLAEAKRRGLLGSVI